MNYRFSEEADRSLTDYSVKVRSEIIELIEEAVEEDFYNHESYSYIYDNYGRPWDKLDLKTEGLNHRVFFKKRDETVVILEIFDRDDLDYDDKGIYRLLSKVHEDMCE